MGVGKTYSTILCLYTKCDVQQSRRTNIDFYYLKSKYQIKHLERAEGSALTSATSTTTKYASVTTTTSMKKTAIDK